MFLTCFVVFVFCALKSCSFLIRLYARVKLLICYLQFLFYRHECVVKVLCVQCAGFYITLNAEIYFDVEDLFWDNSIIEFLFFCLWLKNG